MCILQVTAQWFGNIEIMFSQLEKSGKPKNAQLMKNIVIFFLKTVKFRTGMVNKKYMFFRDFFPKLAQVEIILGTNIFFMIFILMNLFHIL